MADALTIKLWLEPEELAAVRSRLERERLADLALSDRLAREWADLDLLELGDVREAA